MCINNYSWIQFDCSINKWKWKNTFNILAFNQINLMVSKWYGNYCTFNFNYNIIQYTFENRLFSYTIHFAKENCIMPLLYVSNFFAMGYYWYIVSKAYAKMILYSNPDSTQYFYIWKHSPGKLLRRFVFLVVIRAYPTYSCPRN